MTEPQPNSILNTSTGHHERLVTSLIALENFLAEIRAAADREEIMALTLVDLRSLIPILTAGFYFPRPEGFDFALHTRLEPAEAERLNGLVDQAIDSGVFGWALKHSRPAAFKTRDGKNTLLLAALRTRQRLLGMFAALVGPQSAVEWDASTLVLATHLACAADAMLTDDLTLELQNQNRRLDSLVAQRTQQLLEAKEAAELANRAKSSFLATISHELRTPLNAILGYTQILLGNDLAAEDPRESIQTIHASAEHLLALINDLLDLSKVEASAIEIFPQPVALHRLIRETADLVRPLDRRAFSRGVVSAHRAARREFRIVPGRRGFRAALRPGGVFGSLCPASVGVASGQRRPGPLERGNGSPHRPQPGLAAGAALPGSIAPEELVEGAGGARFMGRAGREAWRAPRMAARRMAGVARLAARPRGPGFLGCSAPGCAIARK